MRFLNLKKENQPKAEVNIPWLPKDISYNQLIFMTKRGFLARKIACYLEMGQQDLEKIYFSSLSKITFDDLEMGELTQKCLYLSECLLNWIKEGEKVKAKVDELSETIQIKNAILKAYDIHKNSIEGRTVHKETSKQINSSDKWKVYRDVMYSATQGKFLLINKEEIEGLRTGTILVEREIKVLSDIPKCRMAVKSKLELNGYNKTELMSWLLVISEAITNTLKHAEEGKMILVEDKGKNELRVIVEDKGAGFDLVNLPKATLMAGYSTKKSLGQGFQLMLKMSKQVFLYTSDFGSTIIVTFEVNKVGDKLNRTGS